MTTLQRLLSAGVLAVASAPMFAATFATPRSDFRDETIYFAMTTRFYDGDHSNNTYCWDGVKNVNDPEWRGDFKGLIEKLDYIKALGFTAVWITPVVENCSGLDYHGYHAFDFSKVDPRYESEDVKFQDLIDAAHARGMKIILDVVLQHTGNFGENFLCPQFEKDYSQPQSNINKILRRHPDSMLPANYDNLQPGAQYQARLTLMKNNDNSGKDPHNYWHHVGQAWDWDDYSRVWGQIAGDCVDLNTENPFVYDYLIDCYTKFIEMGVDGFRIDTSGHIARVTFNKAFIPRLHAAAEKAKAKRGGTPFFMFGEVCARAEEVIYRNQNYNCSPCFYTWAESRDYDWSDDASSWDGLTYSEASPSDYSDHPNTRAVLDQASSYAGHADAILEKSDNALLSGNDYHTPDYSRSSRFNVIDFPMHWRFHSAKNAFGVRSQDNLYNDATWNVVYIDGHDYGPNGWDTKSFGGSLNAWAENYALMFTWRGIPCIFQGSESYFRKGSLIDKGAIEPLDNTSRAYYGGYLTGDVETSDFAEYTSATGNVAATLTHPLAVNLRRLNKIRAAVPALRKGQYSTDGCSGEMAFKRRYTDANTDSYCLVTISGNATFTGVLNGTYTDVVTGDVKTVTDGRLTATCSGQGNLRCYVLTTDKTPAPGKIGDDTAYIYSGTPSTASQLEYDGQQEAKDTETVRDNGGGGGGEIVEPEVPVEPSMSEGEQAVFFENSSDWGGTINCYAWSGSTQYAGAWPGATMTYLGRGVWKWTYTGNAAIPTSAGVIFNNGDTQTADLTWVNGGYYNATGYVKTIEGAGEIVVPETPKSFTVYFTNSASWDKIYIYSWDSDGGTQWCGKWPGAPVTEKTTVDGTEYYTYTIDCSYTPTAPMVIFNNGSGTQTADLILRDHGVYNCSGDTGTSAGISATPFESALKVSGSHGTLRISTPLAGRITATSLDGTVRTLTLTPGTNTFTLPSGFYIVVGRKVLL